MQHRDIFEAVAQGVGTDDPAVRELMFENYDAFKDEDEILKNIVILKVGFYENLHKEYSMKQIPLEEKKQILTKIKKIIEALKK